MTHPDPTGEEAMDAIRQVHEAWLAAELHGDVEGVLRLCTPDVRWLVPGRPVVEGREAGRRLLEADQVDLLDVRSEDLRIEQSEELAVKTSRYETRYGAAGQEGNVRGTYLWSRLTAAGRMTPYGQRHVDAARADGRWDAAYAPIRSATEATIPDDPARPSRRTRGRGKRSGPSDARISLRLRFARTP